MNLTVEVSENGRILMRDKISVVKLTEACLKKIFIPGLNAYQMQMLCLDELVQYRHLGLDYKIEVEGKRK